MLVLVRDLPVVNYDKVDNYDEVDDGDDDEVDNALCSYAKQLGK